MYIQITELVRNPLNLDASNVLVDKANICLSTYLREYLVRL